MSLPPDTGLGAVRLRVADTDALTAFYERVLGLRALERDGGAVALGAAGGPPLLVLDSAPDASRRPPRSPGLFHLAILVPTRAELARALSRVAGAGWRLTGASDHLVSEALYLSDPEGNGIEIYRDRPRSEWRHDGGELQMATLPLDLEGLLTEPGTEASGSEAMAPGARIGHVHLQVSAIPAAEAFYGGALGLDVTVRSYPGALFLSAGGYHHHVGMNTWRSAGGPPAPNGALGLERYELRLPGAADRDAAVERLASTAAEPVALEDGVLVRDPSGNGVLLSALRA